MNILWNRSCASSFHLFFTVLRSIELKSIWSWKSFVRYFLLFIDIITIIINNFVRNISFAQVSTGNFKIVNTCKNSTSFAQTLLLWSRKKKINIPKLSFYLQRRRNHHTLFGSWNVVIQNPSVFFHIRPKVVDRIAILYTFNDFKMIVKDSLLSFIFRFFLFQILICANDFPIVGTWRNVPHIIWSFDKWKAEDKKVKMKKNSRTSSPFCHMKIDITKKTKENCTNFVFVWLLCNDWPQWYTKTTETKFRIRQENLNWFSLLKCVLQLKFKIFPSKTSCRN